LNVPEAVGAPLMVIVFDAHAAVTPAGSPVAVPIPVAPVVVCVMFVKAVLIHNVGVDDAVPAVLVGLTVTVAVLLAETVLPTSVDSILLIVIVVDPAVANDTAKLPVVDPVIVTSAEFEPVLEPDNV
jgi:hypothetical protein